MSHARGEVVTRGDDAFLEMYPFEPHYHSIGSHRLHYVDEGEGAPVVMVHGNPTWSFYYRRLAGALRDGQRVIVPDHMGCGFSDKPQDYEYTLLTHIDNLESLLSGLGLEGVTLVLHDWGGAIGMGYATRHPENIRKIIVLNTSAFYSSAVPLRISLCRMPLLGPLIVRGLNGFARAALTMAVRERMSAEICDGYLMPYDSWANRVAILRFVQDIPRSPDDASCSVIKDIEDKLSLLKEKPMLIQWGGRDWCFDKTFLDGWRTRFPEAEVDVYDDAGHYVLEDVHQYIVPKVKGFISQ